MKAKLDKLNELLNLLPLNKFRHNEKIYSEIFDWFIDEGEQRVYFDGTAFMTKITKDNLDFITDIRISNKELTLKWKLDQLKLIKHFWNHNKNIAFCTNNCYRTVEEIQTAFNIVSYTDTTKTYIDGSIGNIFDLSKVNKNSILLKEAEFIEILNNLK